MVTLDPNGLCTESSPSGIDVHVFQSSQSRSPHHPRDPRDGHKLPMNSPLKLMKLIDKKKATPFFITRWSSGWSSGSRLEKALHLQAQLPSPLLRRFAGPRPYAVVRPEVRSFRTHWTCHCHECFHAVRSAASHLHGHWVQWYLHWHVDTRSSATRMRR